MNRGTRHPSETPQPVGLFTPNLKRLLLVSFTGTLGFFAFSGFLSPYLRGAGVSVVAVGVFFSLISAFEAPSAIIGGILADRVGRRPVYAVGRILRTIGWAVALLFPTAAGLVTAAVFLGLAALAGACYRALIAESAAPGRRAGAFSAAGVVENATGVVVPLAIGALADRLGLRSVLMTAAVVSGATTAIVVFWLRETMEGACERRGRQVGRRRDGAEAEIGTSLPAATAVQELAAGLSPIPASPGEAAAPAAGAGVAPRTSVLEGFRFLFTPEGRGAALMAVIWFVTGLEMSLLPPVWGLFVTDRFGVDYAGLGAVTMTIALGAMLGQFVGGWVADRVGYSKVMIISLIATAPAWLLMGIAPTPVLLGVLTTATFFVADVAASSWEAISAESVPTRMRGSVVGTFTALQSAGAMLAGALAGLAYSAWISLPFLLVSVADLVILLLVVLGRRAGLTGFGSRGSAGDIWPSSRPASR